MFRARLAITEKLLARAIVSVVTGEACFEEGEVVLEACWAMRIQLLEVPAAAAAAVGATEVTVEAAVAERAWFIINA